MPPTRPERHGRLILGLQPVREAVRAHGRRLTRVAVARGGAQLDALARFAADQGVPLVARVSRSELDRLSAGMTAHQGAAAWGPPLGLVPLEQVLADPSLLAVALDGVQDPQNFGAVVRSAVGVAGAAVLWPESASAPLSPATFRASAGAIEHARLCRVRSLASALQLATDRGATVVALDPRAAVELREVDLTVPTLLVLGGEHVGLGRAVRRSCSVAARLVRPSGVESLNVSAAAAIALYEARIQREIRAGYRPTSRATPPGSR